MKGVHIGEELNDILVKNNFIVNKNKTRIFDYHKRQEVTGFVVNQFVNIKREYIKKIRAILHHCRKDGIYETAKVYIEKDSLNCSKDDYVFLKYAKELNEIFEEEIFHIDEELQLLNKIEKSVFILEAVTNDNYVQGSGFIVKDIGLITNYHVTEGNEIYSVNTYKNEKVCSISNEMNLVKNNPDIDYACYSFGKQSKDALDLGSSKELAIGSDMLVVGYPDYVKGNSPEIQLTNIISERFFMGQRIYTHQIVLFKGLFP